MGGCEKGGDRGQTGYVCYDCMCTFIIIVTIMSHYAVTHLHGMHASKKTYLIADVLKHQLQIPSSSYKLSLQKQP